MSYEFEPCINHHFSDGLYSNEMHIPKGASIGKHVHTYSHLSILAKGSVNVIADDKTTLYTAPVCINIKANIVHEVHALEDSVWYCIHNTDKET